MRVVAVDRRRRPEQERRNAVAPAGVEQRRGPVEVHRRVQLGLGDRRPHAGSRGQVHARRRPRVGAQRAVERRGVADVGLDQAGTADGLRRRRDVPALDRRIVERVEVVERRRRRRPSARSRSTRCEPMNPAPPVTRIAGPSGVPGLELVDIRSPGSDGAGGVARVEDQTRVPNRPARSPRSHGRSRSAPGPPSTAFAR